MFDRLIDWFINAFDHVKPIVFIFEYEEAVLYRGGRFIRVLKPGPHFKVPYLDDYHVENVKMDTMHIDSVGVTTLDDKTISIACEFDFFIQDLRKALVDTNDWRSNLHDICSGIISDQVEDSNWEDIRKKVVKNRISKRIEERALEMGVVVSNFNFTHKAVVRGITHYANVKNG